MVGWDFRPTVGDLELGGGGDSIALWLAIIGLVAGPPLGALFYRYALRPLRLRGEKKRYRGEGQGASCGTTSQPYSSSSAAVPPAVVHQPTDHWSKDGTLPPNSKCDK